MAKTKIIKETIERQCCDFSKDLISIYAGVDTQGLKVCIYCGQIWARERFTDAAGDSDWDWKVAKKFEVET